MKIKIFYSENTGTFPGIIARNNAVLEYEKFIHRTYYPYIIHPYSKFRVNLEKIVLVMIPVRLAVVSLLWAIIPHRTALYQIPLLLFQFINLLDVILNFFTGYVESKTEIAILEPRRIVRKYLTSYFVIDFIPCLPFEVFYLVDRKGINTYENWEIFSDVLVHCLYFRYFSFLRYFRNLSKILLWNNFLIGLVSVTVGIIFTVFFANDLYSVVVIFNHPERMAQFKQFSYSFEMPSAEVVWKRSSTYYDQLIALVLDCLFYESNIPECCVYIRGFILISNFFLTIIFVGYFIKYVLLRMTPMEKFFDLESRVLTFIRIRHLSRILENKTLLYFKILLENKSYREDEIFNYIPDTFKADIFFHLCLPLLKHFYAFEDLPTYVLRRLAECMKYQLYLPNEVVLNKDDEKPSMFFVHRGTVALYSSKHVELYHFEGGSSFNGRNLILGEPATDYYAISIEVAEVYRLNMEDFDQIMRSYPILYEGVRQKIVHDKAGGSIF